MARQLLKDALLEKTDPAKVAGGRLEVWDELIEGFGYRGTRRGVGSFFVMTRIGGKQRRITIGRYPVMTLAKAREAATEHLQLARAGIDPAERVEAQRKATAAAAVAAEQRRFASVVDRFILEYHRGVVRGVPKDPPNNKSWGEVERIFAKYVTPTWGERDVASIKRGDVARLLDTVAKTNGPIMANRTLAHVRKMFNWCLVQPDMIDVLEASPVVPGMAPGKETERDRFLAPAEIARVWGPAEAIGYPFGSIVLLLLATGQRRDEVATMRWADLPTLDAGGKLPADPAARIWTLPKESTKAARRHEVMLSDLAVEIIESLPRTDSPFVFTTTGKTAVSGFSVAKRALDKAIAKAGDPLPNWTYHDLRRTVASLMEDELGIARSTISAVLNHAEGGATAVYTKAHLRDDKARAMQAWGRFLAKTVGRPVAENVVELRAAR